jgi:hypothetical protein
MRDIIIFSISVMIAMIDVKVVFQAQMKVQVIIAILAKITMFF